MPASLVLLQGNWIIASAGCHCMLDMLISNLRGLCENELQEAGEAVYLLVKLARGLSFGLPTALTRMPFI